MIAIGGFPKIPLVRDTNMLVSSVPDAVKLRLRRVFFSDGNSVGRFIPWDVIPNDDESQQYDAGAVNSYQGGDMSTLPGCKFSQGVTSFQNSVESSSYRDDNHRCFHPSVIWGAGNDIRTLSNRNYSAARSMNGSIEWDSTYHLWKYVYNHSSRLQDSRYSAYCLSLHRAAISDDQISPKITKMVIPLVFGSGQYAQDVVVDNDEPGNWETWYSGVVEDDAGNYGYVVRLDVVSKMIRYPAVTSLYQGVGSPMWVWKFRDSTSVHMPLASGAYILETGFVFKWLDYAP